MSTAANSSPNPFDDTVHCRPASDRDRTATDRDVESPTIRQQPAEKTDEPAKSGTRLGWRSASAGPVPERPCGASLSAPGAMFGRYRLENRIGAGGMGVVYRAYDPMLERVVALKVVRPSLGGKAAQRRLFREAQALARVRHANVVAIHDVGVLGRDVFIAMEYAPGQTVTQWLATSPRPTEEILRVFRAAGAGLAAAHRVGLVHRDFKRSNVIVGEDGRVQVIDFGLARPSARDATRDSKLEAGSPSYLPGELAAEVTEAWARAGTVAYMSPEQHRCDVLDHRSDQFSYCVALYVALHEQHPFGIDDGETDPASALLRPPRSAPRDGRAVPEHVQRAIERGLARDAADRFGSMHALVAALAANPVRRRRRIAAVAACVALASSGGGLSLDAWTSARAQRCSGAADALAGAWSPDRRAAIDAAFAAIDKPFATEAWRRAGRALDAYAVDWRRAHTDACAAHTVRGEQTADTMTLRMVCLERAKRSLDATARVLASADLEVAQNVRALAGELPDLAQCADLAALRAAIVPPPARDRDGVERAETQLADAKALSGAGRYQPAADALDAAETALGDIDYGPTRVELAVVRAGVLGQLGRYADAEGSYRRAIELAARYRRHDALFDAARGLMMMLGVHLARPDDAWSYRELVSGLAAGDAVREMSANEAFAAVLQSEGKYAEAVETYRNLEAEAEAGLGPEHPRLAELRAQLGNALAEHGEYAAAERVKRRALAVDEVALGPDHPAVAFARMNLGGVLSLQGKHAEAEHALRRAVAGLEAGLVADHPILATAWLNLGYVLVQRRKYAEAEATLRRALAATSASLGPNHPDTAVARMNLGIALDQQDKHGDAETELRRSLDDLHAALGPDHPFVARARMHLGVALHHRGKYAEAEGAYRLSLAAMQASLGPEHPEVASLRLRLARLANR